MIRQISAASFPNRSEAEGEKLSSLVVALLYSRASHREVSGFHPFVAARVSVRSSPNSEIPKVRWSAGAER